MDWQDLFVSNLLVSHNRTIFYFFFFSVIQKPLSWIKSANIYFIGSTPSPDVKRNPGFDGIPAEAFFISNCGLHFGQRTNEQWPQYQSDYVQPAPSQFNMPSLAPQFPYQQLPTKTDEEYNTCTLGYSPWKYNTNSRDCKLENSNSPFAYPQF